MEKCWSR